ncbi:EBNA1BP2 [Cordylochernes scorpioides]|uniref:EBNA1BP2 n=1 Tax=Cordylochernes scorpioides TaxID=51811 RepID=A0ABY6K068_9ARAC|nr:EBNA1BP2 [Cordylochernes scorpioides]
MVLLGTLDAFWFQEAVKLTVPETLAVEALSHTDFRVCALGDVFVHGDIYDVWSTDVSGCHWCLRLHQASVLSMDVWCLLLHQASALSMDVWCLHFHQASDFDIDVWCLQESLANKLKEFRLGLEWMETKDLVCAPVPETEDVIERGQVNPAFRQEMQYFRLAQAVIQEGLPRVGKAMLRPADYFAEMARPDKQMQKVRAKMLQKKKELEQAQKAREAREMRKYGKKIQQEVLRQKHQEKKATLENIKKYVKGKKKNLDFLNEKGGIKNRQGGISKKNKRLLKDNKFGFGGKKRGLKQNTAASYAEPYMEVSLSKPVF